MRDFVGEVQKARVVDPHQLVRLRLTFKPNASYRNAIFLRGMMSQRVIDVEDETTKAVLAQVARTEIWPEDISHVVVKLEDKFDMDLFRSIKDGLEEIEAIYEPLFDALVTGVGKYAMLFQTDGTDHVGDFPLWVMHWGEEDLQQTDGLHPGMLAQGLGISQITDFQIISNLTTRQIREWLDFNCLCEEALYSFVMILLDPETGKDIREEALLELEQMLDNSAVAEWLTDKIIKHPLPEEVSLTDAMEMSKNSPKVMALLTECQRL